MLNIFKAKTNRQYRTATIIRDDRTQHADKVILVEDGRIKDSGSFKELISRNPSVERVVDLMRVEKD